MCVVDSLTNVHFMSKTYVYVFVLLAVSFIAVQLHLNNAALVDASDVAAVSRTAAVARIRCDSAVSSHVQDSTHAIILLTAALFCVRDERQSERVRDTELCILSD